MLFRSNAVFAARSTTNVPFTVLAFPTAAFANSAVIPASAKPKLPQIKFLRVSIFSPRFLSTIVES